MTVGINGTTGVSLVQPGAITQADLGANVVGNGPAFSVYQSVAQTVPSSTTSQFAFQIVEFDTANAFNLSGSRFMPLVAGYYFITAVAMIHTASGSATYIYKNGVVEKIGTFAGSDGGNSYSNATGLVYLNGSSDYVTICGWQNSGANQQSSTGHAYSYFQGFLARAA